MAISVDGNSLVIENATITISNAMDPTTGTSTITITPAGGLATLPALAEGQPGLPPVLRNINLNQVPSGQGLPDNAATWSVVAPGGPGVASVYDLTLYLNEGPTGQPGVLPNSLQALTNATENPTVSSPSGSVGVNPGGTQPSDVLSLAYDTVAGSWNWMSRMVGAIFTPPASSTSGNSYTRQIATATIPAQSNPYIPQPHGNLVVTHQTTSTNVNLIARLNDPNTGPICGQGWGVAAAAANTGVPTSLSPSYPSGTAVCVVPAGQAATVYFMATQINTTSTDPWVTDAATTTFTVTTIPQWLGFLAGVI